MISLLTNPAPPKWQDDSRCDQTELVHWMCAHCRGHRPAPVRLASRGTATKDGECEHCGEWYEAGQPLGKATDNSLVCWRCLP